MITYFKRSLNDEGMRKLDKFEPGCWINVVNPTDKEIKYLAQKFELDEQNLISGIDPHEIPRLDLVEKDAYIFVNTVSSDFRELPTYLITITDKFILTLSKHTPGFLDDIIENRIEFITTQKLKCLIKLLSMIDKGFDRATINIVKQVRSKKSIMSKLKEKEVNALLEYEDLLNNLVSSYYHMNLLYEKIIQKMRFFEDDREILDDLIVEANEGFNLCKSSLKTISNIRNYYMVLLSNKLNRIITILTIFTIFISIPAAISGIYGMNIKLPFQENAFAFRYVLFLMGALWIVFILYLKKKDVI